MRIFAFLVRERGFDTLRRVTLPVQGEGLSWLEKPRCPSEHSQSELCRCSWGHGDSPPTPGNSLALGTASPQLSRGSAAVAALTLAFLRPTPRCSRDRPSRALRMPGPVPPASEPGAGRAAALPKLTACNHLRHPVKQIIFI